ncbi:hypothetical protein IWW45_000104 [Coemansia sp. RSA 485]|nr:hypothetical protein IWW45_000104 [Coemansia sp. RSA 485]
MRKWHIDSIALCALLAWNLNQTKIIGQAVITISEPPSTTDLAPGSALTELHRPSIHQLARSHTVDRLPAAKKSVELLCNKEEEYKQRCIGMVSWKCPGAPDLVFNETSQSVQRAARSVQPISSSLAARRARKSKDEKKSTAEL